MSLKMRMARGGRKQSPFYRIVVADSRAPRDGKFIEKVGTYNPLLGKDNENRVVLNTELVKKWLAEGAQPSDRVARFLGEAGIIPMPKQNNNPEKAKPKAKALERVKEKEEKAAAAAEAAKEAEEAANAETESVEATEEATAAEESTAETTDEATTAEESTETETTEETATETPEETTAESSEEATAEEETKAE